MVLSGRTDTVYVHIFPTNAAGKKVGIAGIAFAHPPSHTRRPDQDGFRAAPARFLKAVE
jgi:hypothetical protein